MSKDKASSSDIKTKKQKTRGKRAPKKITETYLHNAGLYYLQRFAASSYQFKEVMMRKVKKSCYHHTDQDFAMCAELVNALVKKFEEAGLLNDALYARGTVNSMRRQGKSAKTIITKLKIKGVKNELIKKTLAEYDNEEAGGELKAALIFARKKKIGPYGQGKDAPPEKQLAKLARAGFSYDIARSILDMNIKEAETAH